MDQQTKILFLFALSFPFLISHNALAMGNRLPEKIRDISIEGKTSSPFSLVDTQGQIVQFTGKSPELIDTGLLNYLPAEKGSNKKLCGENLSTSLLLTQTDMVVQLSEIYMSLSAQGSSAQLTSEQAKFLSKAPRCKMFLTQLNIIAGQLSGQSTKYNIDNSLAKFSLITNNKKNALEFITGRGNRIQFNIASSLKNIQDVSDISGIVVTPETSGQNLGIRFIFTNEDAGDIQHHPPSMAPCTYYETVHHCNHKGQCDTFTVERPGYKWDAYTSQTIVRSFRIELYAKSGFVVYSGTFSDYEFKHNSQGDVCR